MHDPKFSLLGHHFSEFITSRTDLKDDERTQLYELLLRLTSSLEDGHICVKINPPEHHLLRKVPLAETSDGTDDDVSTPLVVCNGNLYLGRYYLYEVRLAKHLAAMAGNPARYPVDKDNFGSECEEMLESLFPPSIDSKNQKKPEVVDYQKEAARLALKKQLAIISGGPGTGKTSTVVKILALIIRFSDTLVKIGLAAPTGKAAMRLSESIGNSLSQLDLPEEIAVNVPTSASTLHRLLGVRRNSPRFQHNYKNPMVWDVVVVDEASMVDLALMSKLVDGLKEGAQLILLGDKDQLASVESGAVLADLIASLPECSIELKKSYRFDNNIKELASSVNSGDVKKAWGLLKDPKYQNIGLLSEKTLQYASKNYSEFLGLVENLSGGNLDDAGVNETFQRFQEFQLLCAVRYGEHGVVTLNQQVELTLARKGYLCRPGQWYAGRPVLITRNDYGLDLYNGDIGICLPDGKDEGLKVWFQQSKGRLKSFHPNRLPPCETVFAMTIHKSQGSEFGEVVVVLPVEDNRVLSRELVYTGITRGKKKVTVAATKEVLSLALERTVDRQSGLREIFTASD